MKKLISAFALALAAAVSPLAAQDKGNGLEADLGLMLATAGDMKTNVLDGKTFAGWQLGLAYRFPLESAGIDMRFHGEFLSINAPRDRSATMRYPTGIRKENLNYSVGVDALTQQGKWGLFGGLLAFSWNPYDKNLPPADTSPSGVQPGTNDPYPNQRPVGVKMGVRLGAEYNFTPKLAARLVWTQAEYNRTISPSWFTAGVVYRF